MCAYPKLKQQQKIRSRERLALFEQTKTGSGFGQQIGSVFEENQPRILGKSVTDFGEISHGFWENLTPILRKSVTDCGEICPGVWGNPPPTLGKLVTDFEEIYHRF